MMYAAEAFLLQSTIQLPTNWDAVEWWYEEMWHCSLRQIIDVIENSVGSYREAMKVIAACQLLEERIEKASDSDIISVVIAADELHRKAPNADVRRVAGDLWASAGEIEYQIKQERWESPFGWRGYR